MPQARVEWAALTDYELNVAIESRQEHPQMGAIRDWIHDKAATFDAQLALPLVYFRRTPAEGQPYYVGWRDRYGRDYLSVSRDPGRAVWVAWLVWMEQKEANDAAERDD